MAALIALTSAQEKTAAQKESIAAMVDELNESVPGLNLAYDDQTESLNMTTEALREYVAALAPRRSRRPPSSG